MDPTDLFPAEIWEKIFSEVSNPNDLLSCAQANQILTNVLQERLVHIKFRCVLPIALRWIGLENLSRARLTCRSWKKEIESCLQNLPIFRPSPSPDCQDEDVWLRNMLYSNPLSDYMCPRFLTFTFATRRDIASFLSFSSPQRQEDGHHHSNRTGSCCSSTLFCGSVGFDCDYRFINRRQEEEDEEEEEEDEEGVGDDNNVVDVGLLAQLDEPVVNEGVRLYFEELVRFFEEHGSSVKYLGISMMLNSVISYERYGQVLIRILSLAPNLRSLTHSVSVRDDGEEQSVTYINDDMRECLVDLPDLTKLESFISPSDSPAQIDRAVFSKYRDRLSRIGMSGRYMTPVEFGSRLRNLMFPRLVELYLYNIEWDLTKACLNELREIREVKKLYIGLDPSLGNYMRDGKKVNLSAARRQGLDGWDVQTLLRRFSPERFELNMYRGADIFLDFFDENNMMNKCLKLFRIYGYREVPIDFLRTFVNLQFLDLGSENWFSHTGLLLEGTGVLPGAVDYEMGSGVIRHPYYRVKSYFDAIPSLRSLVVGKVLFHRDMDGSAQEWCNG